MTTDHATLDQRGAAAIVAHELTSSLAAIRGHVEMMATGELAPSQTDDSVEAIRNEVDILSLLVDDLRTCTAIEEGRFRLNIRPVDLSQLLTDAAGYAHALPGDHPISASSHFQVRVLADAARIGQLLRNLLSNAAKYSPPKTPIALRAERRGQRVAIQVVDAGVGIDGGDASMIFEKNYRLDTHNAQVAGFGLGLYVARRIARAHGSELHVRSTRGEGSVFEFELEVVP